MPGTSYRDYWKRYERGEVWSYRTKLPYTSSYDVNTYYTGNVDASIQITRSWANTPNYRSVIKAGGILPDNPYAYTEIGLTLNTVIFNKFERYPDYVRATTLTLFPCYGMSYYTFSPHTFSINQKLISKMKGNEWNAPIFAAEAAKTGRMVAETADQLAHLIFALRRGDLKMFLNLMHPSAPKPSGGAQKRFQKAYGVDATAAVSSYWLQWKYGWSPFVKDVYDAMNALMDIQLPADALVHSVKASMRMSGSFAENNVQLVYASNGAFQVKGDRVTVWDESYRAVWRFKPNAVDLPARLGLLNPLEIVWELVPFSFVGDWFLPIGDYLKALDVPFRISHVGGSYGLRQTSSRTVVAARPGDTSYSVTGVAGSGKWVNVKRTSMSSAPDLKLAQMTAKFDLGAEQVMSSISLLRQQASLLVARRDRR